ncbi:superoxide dismutase [Clostridium sp. D33t1_170424_F3]|uniref:superoxide dismutase n=1 Tax=Clostridium sp. D33t1_170424_F3 TaxID=2787099 RepID=UPI0018AB6E85|nr:superoxide dismutase [Clostridium sp. D33t1_170424_F3]
MSQHYPFTLEPLPYAYDALEPQIDAETLHFHHDKHLQTYVDNLNKTLEKYPDYHDWSLEKLISQGDSLPEAIRTPVRNNAGGVYNHQLYFRCMGPEKDTRPSQRLLEEINRYFGSFEDWKEKMKNAAVTQFGSGWAWLVVDPEGRMHVVKTPNQDTPLPNFMRPLLLVDVWEHAYYLQYQNRRPEYVDRWFSVINWKQVEENFEKSFGC